MPDMWQSGEQRMDCKGGGFMDKQMVSFAVETENGIVKRIGRSVIAVPEVKFRGGEVKWLEDKYKGARIGKESKTWGRS